MKKYQIIKYELKYFEVWNAFVNQAKNATFLFHRDFMEYHQDRFDDFSLLIFENNNKLVAVLPANKAGEVLYSHQGLTYGGMVLSNKAKLADVILIFQQLLQFLNENQIEKLQIKQIPSFYCNSFSDEINYCIFLAKGIVIASESLSTINLTQNFKIANNRIEGVKKGIKNQLIIKEVDDFDGFWNEILIPGLQSKYQKKPVHSLDEIKKLKSFFPKNIKQFNVYYDEKIVAGTTIFETNNVAHAQYIFGNETKKELGSLDFLFQELIKNTFKNKLYFDFGTSNEEQGRKINEGLLFWKESFVAKTVIQNFYEIETKNFKLFDTVFI